MVLEDSWRGDENEEQPEINIEEAIMQTAALFIKKGGVALFVCFRRLADIIHLSKRAVAT